MQENVTLAEIEHNDHFQNFRLIPQYNSENEIIGYNVVYVF